MELYQRFTSALVPYKEILVSVPFAWHVSHFHWSRRLGLGRPDEIRAELGSGTVDEETWGGDGHALSLPSHVCVTYTHRQGLSSPLAPPQHVGLPVTWLSKRLLESKARAWKSRMTHSSLWQKTAKAAEKSRAPRSEAALIFFKGFQR